MPTVLSDVGIANLALLKLGKSRISSFDDANTTAQIFAEQYYVLRDKLQRMGWNFNRRYATLAASLTAPPFQYAYAFALPSDFLRVYVAGPAQPLGSLPPNSVPAAPPQSMFGMPGANITEYNNALLQDYSVVGQQIWTNIPVLSLIYFARIEDPTQFDLSFVESLASYLAWQLCERITGSNEKKPGFRDEYMLSIAEAKKYKSLEQPPQEIPDDTHMLARVSS